MTIIHLKNSSMYYERSGKGQAVLFLHGLGSSSDDWIYQKNFFKDKCDVIAPDLRGHGKSDKKGPFTIQTSAEDIKEFIEILDLPPVHLVGLSYGSFVALQLAITHPERVKSLTITGTTSRVKDTGYLNLFYRYLLLQLFPMELVGKKIASALFPDPEQEMLYTSCASRIGSNDKTIYKACAKALYHFDVSKELGRVFCPTLIVGGEKDPLFPPSHGQKLHKAIPHSQFYVIEGARHAAPLDSPDQFNRLLNYFLYGASAK